VESRKSGLRGGRVGVEFASEGVEKKRKKENRNWDKHSNVLKQIHK